MGNSPEHYFKLRRLFQNPEGYFKIIGVILNGDFIQGNIRYTISICNRWVSCAIWEKLGSEIGRG